ncbi:MAG: DUF3306 domain-containing protein [Rhizobiaceae bacterium]
MSDEDKNTSRLSRWSKRKLAVAEETKNDVLPEEDIVDAEAAEALAAEYQANREAAEAIDIEAIDEDTDFSVFMKDGVPDLLKKTAMAVLWRTNPIFANVDGLVDYDDDFGSPDLIMKTFESAYKIGKGYLEKVEEEEDADGVEEVAEDATDDATGEEDVAVVDEEEITEELEEDADSEQAEISEDEIVLGQEQTEIALVEEAPELPKVSLRSRLMLNS